jgi:thiamine monophosphate kinase
MPKEAKPDDVPLHQETDSPTYADDHNFYKVEKWTRNGTKVGSLLYAGNNLGRARAVFERSIKHRRRIRLTIRQRTRLLDQWPPAHAR